MLDSGALVYPSQGGRYRAEGCMALDSDSIVNDPILEPGRTPLYVGVLSMWGSEDGEQMFCLFLWEGSSDGYERTNKPLALETKRVSIGTLLGNLEGGSFTRGFKGKVNY
jgi:hypothetical protein